MRCTQRGCAPIQRAMRTILSPADRYAACVVALVSMAMCVGVRYVFHLPAHAALNRASTERPYMP